MKKKTSNPDITLLINEGMPTTWICPHCGKEQYTSLYADEILLEQRKYIEHCEDCGYLHGWELELTEDFKKKVVDMLVNGTI